MNPYEFHAEGLAELEAELGAECPPFRWQKQDWKILPGSAECAKNIQVGGFQLGSRLTFSVRTEQFAQTPEVIRSAMLEDEMMYRGDHWTIKLVSIAPLGEQLHIEAHQERP